LGGLATTARGLSESEPCQMHLTVCL